jgi:hypothetical protein
MSMGLLLCVFMQFFLQFLELLAQEVGLNSGKGGDGVVRVSE